MHVITRRTILEFALTHTDANASLDAWYRITKSAAWRSLVETRKILPTADAAGHLTVFNISGNKYRLITRIDYYRQKVFIRAILTHAEYEKEGWKHDPWY